MPKNKKPVTLPKPKRMFVMVEVDSTGLNAKDVRETVAGRLAGHPLVRVLQVDVNVARMPRPADTKSTWGPTASATHGDLSGGES